MADFGRYRTELLGVRPDPRPEEASPALALGGFTVLTYCLARVSAETTAALAARQTAPATEAYRGVFWSEGSCRVTPLQAIGSLAIAGSDWGGPRQAEAHTHYIWASPNHVLAVTAWMLRVARPDEPQPLRMPLIELPDASMATGLAAIAALSDPDLLDRTAALVAGDLGVDRDAVTPVHDALAVDLWDLAGSPVLAGGVPFSGPDHVPRTAYEISALLARTTRHIADDGQWAAQTPDRVFAEMRYGYSFLSNAAAFANAHTCVEVSDIVNTHYREYRRRLELFGYDSTATFVWTVEILRGAVFRELNRTYARLTDALLDERDDALADPALIGTRVSRDQATVEALAELPRDLREGRHRAMSEDVSALRGSDQDLAALSRRIDAYETLARSIRQAQAEHRRAQVNLVLSIFGAAIAIAGLTQIGELVYSWYEGADVVRPVITLVLLLVAAGSTLAVWRRVGSGRGDE